MSGKEDIVHGNEEWVALFPPWISLGLLVIFLLMVGGSIAAVIVAPVLLDLNSAGTALTILIGFALIVALNVMLIRGHVKAVILIRSLSLFYVVVSTLVLFAAPKGRPTFLAVFVPILCGLLAYWITHTARYRTLVLFFEEFHDRRRAKPSGGKDAVEYIWPFAPGISFYLLVIFSLLIAGISAAWIVVEYGKYVDISQDRSLLFAYSFFMANTILIIVSNIVLSRGHVGAIKFLRLLGLFYVAAVLPAFFVLPMGAPGYWAPLVPISCGLVAYLATHTAGYQTMALHLRGMRHKRHASLLWRNKVNKKIGVRQRRAKTKHRHS